jgi:hypothetical protein
MTEGYCVKCRAKKIMVDTQKVVKGGRNMVKGKCPKCQTNMCRIVAKN